MIQLLPIDTLRKMSADELDALARQAVKLEKEAKDATTAHKSSFPAAGKVVCAIEERLNALKAQRLIASNTSLAAYWESITKTRVNNHALSCAVTFGTFVRTELIAERDYDLNTAQCLELAAAISTAVGGDVTHVAVVQTSEQLRERGKDAAKTLRVILDKVKERKTITAEKAAEMLKAIFQDGHLELALHAAGAEVAYVNDAETLERIFGALNLALDHCGTVEQQEAWLEKKAEAIAPVRVAA